MQTLDPDVYFKEIPILKKEDARSFERHLKSELMQWMKRGEKGQEGEEEKGEQKVGSMHMRVLSNIDTLHSTISPSLRMEEELGKGGWEGYM